MRQEVTFAAPGERDHQGAQMLAAFQAPPERQRVVEAALRHTLEGERERGAVPPWAGESEGGGAELGP